MEYQATSEFNNAIQFMNGCNSLFMLAINSRLRSDVYSWFQALISLRASLYNYMGEDTDKADAFVEKLRRPLSIYNARKKQNPAIRTPYELVMLLDEFEIFLRKIYKDAGFETKLMKNPAHSLMQT
jgi:hypothetical protein